METIVVPTLIDDSKQLDLLGRQAFVDKLKEIALILSKNRKNACYAINGGWGVGKSFVLDMFTDQIKDIGQEGEVTSRYLVFRYNCWEYDYYDEPLISIVVSMLDEIDENVNLLSRETRDKLVEVLRVIGKGLLKKTIQVLDEKTGVPIEDVVEVFQEGTAKAKEKTEQGLDFDQYVTFRKTLKKLQATIASLAKDQTIVFVVDELDRCLLTYYI